MVLHFDHRTRDGISTEDAQWVRTLAEHLQLPFVLGVWSGPDSVTFTETKARKARLQFFLRCAEEHRLGAVFLAHHADDVLETQLMRLARGQGGHGLSSPRPVQSLGSILLLRPFLHLPKQRLLEALQAGPIAWREDHTNSLPLTLRNRLRREVIKPLKQIFSKDPAIAAAIARDRLEDEAQLLQWVLAEWYAKLEKTADALHLPDSLPPLPLLREGLVRTWLKSCHSEIVFSRSGWRELLSSISSPTPARCSAGKGGYLAWDGSWLRFEATSPTTAMADRFLPLPGQIEWAGRHLTASWRALSAEDRARILQGDIDPLQEAWLDAEELEWETNEDARQSQAEEIPWESASGLDVRTWRPGDQYHPLRAPGRRKLQDWFVDRKIPPARRRELPLILAPDGTILWVPGFPPAHAFSVKTGTNWALQLTYL